MKKWKIYKIVTIWKIVFNHRIKYIQGRIIKSKKVKNYQRLTVFWIQWQWILKMINLKTNNYKVKIVYKILMNIFNLGKTLIKIH